VAKKKLDRSTAAKVRAKRKAAAPNVRKELEALERILKTSAVGPANALSNAVLSDMLWGKLPDDAGGRNVHDQRQRKLRLRVMQLRRGGNPVALALGRCGGYFWPDGSPDSLAALRATSEMLDKRAETSHKLAARLVGLGAIEYQAERAAARIDNEAEQDKQEAAMRQFVERVTRNPMTAKVFLKVVGQRSFGEEKARLAKLQSEIRAKMTRLKMLFDAGLEEVQSALGG